MIEMGVPVMAKIERKFSRFTRNRKRSRNMWLSILAALGLCATAVIGVNKGRNHRWVRKIQSRKTSHQHETSL